MAEALAPLLPLLMFLTLAALLFSGYPVAFVLGGVGLGFGALGASLGLFSPAEFNNIVFRIWGSVADNIFLVAVPMFVFMGLMLDRSGVAEELLNAMQHLLSRVRGGLAIAVTVMGTVLAASTGIIGSSVVMLGALALPPMLRRGYRTELAVGTIAASGTLGILIPPSIMLVIMGDLMTISVGELFMGAVVPGVGLALLYVAYIAVVATLWPREAPQMTEAERRLPPGRLWRMVLGSFVPPTAMIALVLGSIFVGWATPTEAAGVGAFGALVIALAKRRLDWPTTRVVCERTAMLVAMVFFLLIGATAFSYVFRSLGGEDQVDRILLSLPLGPWGVLSVLMAAIFLLGFFFDWIEITMIVLPVFKPVIEKLDFGGHLPDAHHVVLWFAILVALNLQTSFLTPPFGPALFYLKGVAPPEVQTGHLYRGIIPFVALQLIALVLLMAFPGLATWLPDQVLK